MLHFNKSETELLHKFSFSVCNFSHAFEKFDETINHQYSIVKFSENGFVFYTITTNDLNDYTDEEDRLTYYSDTSEGENLDEFLNEFFCINES